MMLMILSNSSQSAGNMTLHGTLNTPPTCEINNNEPIFVDFGRIGVNKVDGVNYAKVIDYQINCDKEGTGSDLYLSLEGNVTSFDNAAIKTSADYLGIKIMEDNMPFILGSSVKVTITAPPVLVAVPVMAEGSTLTTGDFSATATLQAFYQ